MSHVTRTIQRPEQVMFTVCDMCGSESEGEEGWLAMYERGNTSAERYVHVCLGCRKAVGTALRHAASRPSDRLKLI